MVDNGIDEELSGMAADSAIHFGGRITYLEYVLKLDLMPTEHQWIDLLPEMRISQ